MILLEKPTPIAEGFTLPECPRWHDGRLYFADIKEGRVYSLDTDQANIVAEFGADHSGGIGFLEDGSLITLLQAQKIILRTHNGASSLYADLSHASTFALNDMIVHQDHAYVSQPGLASLMKGEGHGVPHDILHVAPGGQIGVAATGLNHPNGMAIDPSGEDLYVAESGTSRILKFRIDADGSLRDQSVFGQLPQGSIPDGICLDADGGLWAAAPYSAEAIDKRGPGVFRLSSTGEATHLIAVEPGRHALACTLGGPGRSILYICTVAAIAGPEAFAPGAGRIEQVAVPFSGAGIP